LKAKIDGLESATSEARAGGHLTWVAILSSFLSVPFFPERKGQNKIAPSPLLTITGNGMKTLIGLIVLFVTLASTDVNAQLLRTYGIKLGEARSEQLWEYSPQMGLDASWIDPVWGIDAGIFAEFFTDKYFSLVTELHYIQKGCTFTVTGTAIDPNSPLGYSDTGEQKLIQRCNYLSIPVMAKLRIETGTVTPYIAVGPRFEFLLSHPSSHVFDQFKTTELAATAAAGIEVESGFGSRVLFEIGYTMSLSDSFKNDNLTIRNRSISFLVGVQF
jgi:hypothetical protein